MAQVGDNPPRLPPVSAEEATVTGASFQFAEPFAEPSIDPGLCIAPPEFAEEPVATLPATELVATYLPKLDEAGFGIAAFNVSHAWLLGYDDLPPLTITPSWSFQNWSSPASLRLPERVYEASLGFDWRPLDEERGGLSVGLTPGLYGDFERFDRHTFQWTGWALGNYRIGPHWNFLGGLAYVRQLRSNWLPIGGVVWTPDDSTRLELLIPKPKLARLVYADERCTHWLYLAGQLGGGAWSVADTPSDNVLLSYSDLRAMVGWEGFSVAGLQGYAELGYVFARNLSVDNASIFNPRDTLFAQAGFAF